MNIADYMIYALVIIGVLLLIMFRDAQADEIQVTVGSMHFQDGDFNEVNPGFIYGKDLSDNWQAIGGIYRNSYSKTTVTAGIEVQFAVAGPISAGAQAGFATGYEEMTGMEVTPIGTLFLQAWSRPGVRISVIPHKEGAVGLSVVYEL